MMQNQVGAYTSEHELLIFFSIILFTFSDFIIG